MTTWAEIYPPFGVSIACGDLELHGMTPADVPELLDLASEGVVDPDRPYPFNNDWALREPADLRLNSARYYFSTWAAARPDAWSLLFVVRHRGEIVGCQDLMTDDFPITRVARTGSWLGRRHHGSGIGTAMRQLVCAFAFDALGADECRTEAYSDNPASQRVSEKLGYQRVEVRPVNRLGERAQEVRFILTPDHFVRPTGTVTFDGVEAFKEFVGLS